MIDLTKNRLPQSQESLYAFISTSRFFLLFGDDVFCDCVASVAG